ncbi:MAG: hypothetical protein COX07_00040 [Bacteroidetes bacterium CG23_combo_of_CG06-09_8_20_14_all_32_9]|nr:MAG: hypothetical protein COX07_00040 [Bacteroidetes bacterium CG23_combo_of_CG06-09_8_20_14_all_32_9]
MKKVMSIVFAVFYCLNTFSQLKEPWCEKTIKNVFDQTEFIFEGTVIKSQSYLVGTRDVYTSNIISISKILRGGAQIKQGTIDIIEHGGGVSDLYVKVGEGRANYSIGSKGMLFCATSKYPSSNIFSVDNPIRVQLIESVGFYMENLYEPHGYTFKELNEKPPKDPRKKIGFGFFAFGKVFTSKEEFYQFLSKYPNITIPKE